MKKICKISLMAVLCSMTLFFAVPEFGISASAAVPPREGTADPCKDIIRWVYDFRKSDNKLYKRLYNTSTCNWIGDWIYVRDLDENGR